MPHEVQPGSNVSILAAFAGTSVLLTGATGYVGSLVLEQLLFTCPDVQSVCILVRSKRGLSPTERRRRLLDKGLFHRLWSKPVILEKVNGKPLRCITTRQNGVNLPCVLESAHNAHLRRGRWRWWRATCGSAAAASATQNCSSYAVSVSLFMQQRRSASRTASSHHWPVTIMCVRCSNGPVNEIASEPA